MTKTNSSAIELLLFVALFTALIPPVAFIMKALTLMLSVQSSFLLYPSSVLISFLIVYSYKKVEWDFKYITWIKIIIISILLLALSLVFAGYFYDTTFDGQWYHQEAVLFLSRSWNPFYDNLFENYTYTSHCDRILNHYGKSSWFSASVIYGFIPQIQLAKAFHFIALVSSFLFGIYIFRVIFKIKKCLSVLFSFLLAFNPYSVGHLFSFYLDGELTSYFLILIYFLILLSTSRLFLNYTTALIFILLISYFSNLKFTAIIYAFIISVAFLVFSIIKQKNIVGKLLVIYLITAVFTIGFVGYPTYVRNYLSKGHPFYPLMGENNIQKEIMEPLYPANFYNKTRWERFYLSTIAAPEYVSKTIPTTNKRLFSFSKENQPIHKFTKCPYEPVSTFGPFHAEISIISLFVLFVAFLIYFKNVQFLIITIPLIFSVIIIEEFWIIRYTPQIWFIYILGVIALYVHKNKTFKTFAVLISVFILINFTLYYFLSVKKNISQTKSINTELMELKNSEIIVSRGWVKSFQERLDENNIKYTLVKPTNDTIFKSFKTDYFMNWKYKIK